jgi:hypothetical protein
MGLLSHDKFSFRSTNQQALPTRNRVISGVRRTHPQKGNHGNTYWKMLDLWKNDSNVALWRY